MAGRLRGLIRLHEWRVDEKRRKVGDLVRMLADLEAQARRLEEDLVREQRVAAKAPDEGGFLYGRFARTVIERRERLAESIAQTGQELDAARAELADAYRELKKFEIAERVRVQREAEEAARREQNTLDELGLQGFRQRRREAV